MTSELGVCLNKMPPLSRCLLAGSEHRDLPPPLVPLLSPATNQVCQTTFSLSQENGRLLGEKKGTEDEQSLKKRLTLSSRSHRAGTFVLSLSSVDALQMSAAGVWNMSPSLSLVCLYGGVSRGPARWVLIYCASQRQLRQILSTCQCCTALMQASAATQDEMNPLIYFLRCLFVVNLHVCRRYSVGYFTVE